MLSRVRDEAFDLLREPGPSIHRRDCVGASRRANPDSVLGAAILLRISGSAGVMTASFIGTKDKDVLLWVEGPLVLTGMFFARHHWVRYGRKRQGCKIRSLMASFAKEGGGPHSQEVLRRGQPPPDWCDQVRAGLLALQ